MFRLTIHTAKTSAHIFFIFVSPSFKKRLKCYQRIPEKPVYSPFFLYVTIVFCHNRKRDERQIALSSLFCYDRKKNFTSSWPLPPRRRQRRSCRPSGCCQRRGSPSSRRAPGQKSCPRTARRSACGPWYQSCRKRQGRRPCYPDAGCGPCRRRKRRRNTSCPLRGAPSYRCPRPDAGSGSGWWSCR